MRAVALFLLVTTFVCAPIWSVAHFVTQDGSPHLYNAYLMGELLQGNPLVARYAAFNTVAVPNSSGHWLLVLLLQALPPDLVAKLISTSTYVLFVAAIVWLRVRTVGREGVVTSILLGAALGLNWLWLLGLHNFIIGVICFVFATGFYSTRRGAIGAPAALVLSLLLLGAYASHIVSFAIAAASVCVLAVTAPGARTRGTLGWTALAIVPAVLLALRFALVSQGSEAFAPNWRSLGDGQSLAAWFNQLRSADPFIFISRKTLPFSTIQSARMAVFAPIAWIGLSLTGLAMATLRSRRHEPAATSGRWSFALLLGLWILVALVGPNDFGLTNGGVLRERVLLCGLCFVVPLFRTDGAPVLTRVAHASLAFVIVFQTAALWEYAREADVKAQEMLSIRGALRDDDSLASVVIVDGATRFLATPEPHLDTLSGVGRRTMIWDNYELAHYLFPIVARQPDDRRFVLALASSHAFDLRDAQEPLQTQLDLLGASLRSGHDRITTLLVWGTDARIEAILTQWFEAEPFFVNGRVRLFRHLPR